MFAKLIIQVFQNFMLNFQRQFATIFLTKEVKNQELDQGMKINSPNRNYQMFFKTYSTTCTCHFTTYFSYNKEVQTQWGILRILAYRRHGQLGHGQGIPGMDKVVQAWGHSICCWQLQLGLELYLIIAQHKSIYDKVSI